MTKQQYQQIIWTFLHNMKVGTIEELDFLPNKIMPSKIAKAFFIDIVRDFIRVDAGRPAGFYVEFNSAFEKIRKVAYWGNTPPEQRSSPEEAVLKPQAKIQEVEHA